MLEVKNLNAGYGRVQVLANVSLQINQGQIISILGANGAGKSTLIKSISGLVRPASGKILFHGKDITHLPPHQIVAVGISQCPEGRRIFGQMSVLENLLVGASHSEVKKDRSQTLKEVMDIFPRLRERTNQKAGSLSGGEQQMLAVGRALMAKPQLLLLDEPSWGLAPLLVSELFNVIRQLNQKGLTVVLIEQNIQQALKISHHGFVLENGRLVLEGTGDELLTNSETRKAYLGM
ncbi:ABC transporter ATP-binding protein [Paradesulfitobacterium aromaticivorans]